MAKGDHKFRHISQSSNEWLHPSFTFKMDDLIEDAILQRAMEERVRAAATNAERNFNHATYAQTMHFAAQAWAHPGVQQTAINSSGRKFVVSRVIG